jgi:hypothetical protein
VIFFLAESWYLAAAFGPKWSSSGLQGHQKLASNHHFLAERDGKRVLSGWTTRSAPKKISSHATTKPKVTQHSGVYFNTKERPLAFFEVLEHPFSWRNNFLKIGLLFFSAKKTDFCL